MNKPKPAFWPKNPYPEGIFPMHRSEYADVVPDPHLRTALSGMLGREFWEIASDTIWDRLQQYLDDLELEVTTSSCYGWVCPVCQGVNSYQALTCHHCGPVRSS